MTDKKNKRKIFIFLAASCKTDQLKMEIFIEAESAETSFAGRSLAVNFLRDMSFIHDDLGKKRYLFKL